MTQRVEVELRVIDNLVKNTEAISRQFQDHLKRMDGAARQNQAVMSSSASVAGSLRAAYAGVAAIAGGMVAREIFKAGTQVEDLTVQFKVLLGSVGAAKDRLKDLSAFAAATPFQLGEVAEASRTLEIFTKGAFSSGDALRQIGDAAAGSGNSFKDTSFWIGRLYSGLQNGTPIGQETMRLNEMAIISGEARRKIQALAEANAPLKDSIKVLDAEFARFKGSMVDLSQTVSGRTSTALDNLKESIRQVLAGGAWNSLNNALATLNKNFDSAIASGAIKQFGVNIGTAAKIGRDFFIVYTGAKIIAIASAFDKAAFAATGFGRALTLLNANPLFAVAAAGALAISVIATKMDKDAEKLSNVDWLKNADKLKEAIRLQTEYHRILEERAKNPQKIGMAYPGMLDDLGKINGKFKELTNGRTIQDLEGTFGKDFLATQLAALKKIQEFKDKAGKPAGAAAAEAPTVPKGLTEAQNKTLLKLQEDLEKSKVDAEEDGIGKRLALEEAEHQANLRQFGKFSQARLLAEKLHEQKVKNLHADNAKDIQKNVDALDKKRQKERLEGQQDKTAREEKEAEKIIALQENIAIKTAQADAMVLQSKMALAGGIAGAIGQMTGSMEAAFVINQGFAAASIIVNGLMAMTAASAMPPVGVGPIAGPALALKHETAMGFNLAAVLAQTIAGVAGFYEGGYTGNGSSRAVAGVVHGKEFVFDAAATSRIGPQNLEAMRQGGAPSASGGNRMEFNAPLVSFVVQGNVDGPTASRLEKMSRRESNRIIDALARASQERNPRLRGFRK